MKKLFGKKIKELRQKRNISQEKFAELVDLDRKSISNIECGRTFPSTSLVKIARVLGVEIRILFDFNYATKNNKVFIDKIQKKLPDLTTEQLEIISKLIENF